MSWIGLSDHTFTAFDPDGVNAHSPLSFVPASNDIILPVGTLLIETTFTARARMPQRILRYESRAGWHRSLSITLTSEGALSIEIRQGETRVCAQLNTAIPPSGTRLRIYYSWDAPGRRATLTMENLDQELLYQTEFSAPTPLPIEDAHEIIMNSPATRIGPDTQVIAISDKIEPVGLTSGVVGGTPLETQDGPKFVERLRLGDMVMTSTGEAKPVRWIIRREVPAMGHFRPVRLRAPYFGLTRDILAAPDHRVMVAGAEAEYLFNETSVLVQIQHLIDSVSVRRENNLAATLWYYHVLLDRHECLKYAGLWGESLFVGAIGRSREMIATTALADMPFQAIPRHTRFALPILSGYEARTLAAALCA